MKKKKLLIILLIGLFMVVPFIKILAEGDDDIVTGDTNNDDLKPLTLNYSSFNKINELDQPITNAEFVQKSLNGNVVFELKDVLPDLIHRDPDSANTYYFADEIIDWGLVPEESRCFFHFRKANFIDIIRMKINLELGV